MADDFQVGDLVQELSPGYVTVTEHPLYGGKVARITKIVPASSIRPVKGTTGKVTGPAAMFGTRYMVFLSEIRHVRN